MGLRFLPPFEDEYQSDHGNKERDYKNDNARDDPEHCFIPTCSPIGQGDESGRDHGYRESQKYTQNTDSKDYFREHRFNEDW